MTYEEQLKVQIATLEEARGDLSRGVYQLIEQRGDLMDANLLFLETIDNKLFTLNKQLNDTTSPDNP